ncbi:SDR family NAD(P)-dependent oxidoreductase [Pseudolysinimonas sp.]|uniref:SDR family NAD(P)-dependent oxidoreductase n=1 Tax=Pseudolysinimonas sp. TaxID=2680009 RepID=UPI003784685E
MGGTADRRGGDGVRGKIVVVTGASSGIGAAAAQRLADGGATVIAVGRSPERTAAVAARLGTEPIIADFARLDDVERAARELSRLPRIDVLANNAGGVFGDPTKTVDGFEPMFQVNHLAPFLLTRLLLDKLAHSRATVVQTSSVGARMTGKILRDDLQQERRFRPTVAYGTVKLENILFTTELHRRHRGDGIAAVAFHPGTIATGFGTQSESRLMKAITTNPLSRRLMASPDEGADQLVWFASTEPGVEWEPGRYYEKRRVATRVNPQVRDSELASWLWEESERLLGDRLR